MTLPRFTIREQPTRSILSPTSGFIAQAGFTHSLTPARNCTFACTYCYVPTMRIQAGLKPEDWRRWGQFTTFKSNAAEILRPSGSEIVYCSPLTDPYQPAEQQQRLMPAILRKLIASPPALFTIQTRGPLILRDLTLLQELNARTRLRVGFSLTTNRDDVRRRYEPHCASLDKRLEAIEHLRAAGVKTFATLAPILPCDPEALAQAALDATSEDILGDPFHTRAAKPQGATTRPQAEIISERNGFSLWHQPEFQAEIVARISRTVSAAGRRFAIGPQAFAWLAQ